MKEQAEKITEDMGPFQFAVHAPFDQTRAQHITDQDLVKIQRFALKELKAEELAVFHMNLCNDQIDRHSSRFPEKELKTINRMIVGKPTMVNHDMSVLPRGRFFDSRMGRGPTGPQSISTANDALFVQPSTYMLREPENASFIRNIEAGIYSGTSIGFAFDNPECSICQCDLRECAHWPAREYDGEICHYIMHDVVDVFEGSIVPLGSQGTEILEARTEEGQRVLPFSDALKAARDIYHTPIELSESEPKLNPKETAQALRDKRRALRDDEGNI